MTYPYGQVVPPPASKCLYPRVKMTHNNKEYNKTNIHTNIHTTTCALTREEITEEVDRFAEEGNTGAKASLEKDRVIGDKNSFRHGCTVPPPSEMEANDRFAEEGIKGNDVRIIHEGKNKADEVEKLKREIEAGTFQGDIKVPGDIFLEDELIQRKHGLIDAKRNKDDDLRCVFSRFGYQEMVQLTDAQYDYLARTYGEDTAEEYIQRLEYTILNKPGFRSYSHYKTIIRWLKEDMQCADAFAPA